LKIDDAENKHPKKLLYSSAGGADAEVLPQGA
jgi:hypothetical protein